MYICYYYPIINNVNSLAFLLVKQFPNTKRKEILNEVTNKKKSLINKSKLIKRKKTFQFLKRTNCWRLQRKEDMKLRLSHKLKKLLERTKQIHQRNHQKKVQNKNTRRSTQTLSPSIISFGN